MTLTPKITTLRVEPLGAALLGGKVFLQRQVDNVKHWLSQLIQKQFMANDTVDRVVEQLAGASLPSLIKGLGLAVADANKALLDSKSGVQYTIPEAEIELAVALSLEKNTKFEASAGGNIYAFNVNASYANSFGFKAEASSKIRITLRAVLPENPPAAAGGGN